MLKGARQKEEAMPQARTANLSDRKSDAQTPARTIDPHRNGIAGKNATLARLSVVHKLTDEPRPVAIILICVGDAKIQFVRAVVVVYWSSIVCCWHKETIVLQRASLSEKGKKRYSW